MLDVGVIDFVLLRRRSSRGADVDTFYDLIRVIVLVVLLLIIVAIFKRRA
jgi:hypothetical protein